MVSLSTVKKSMSLHWTCVYDDYRFKTNHKLTCLSFKRLQQKSYHHLTITASDSRGGWALPPCVFLPCVLLFRLLPLPTRLSPLRRTAGPSTAATTRGRCLGAILLHSSVLDGDVTHRNGGGMQHCVIPRPAPSPSTTCRLIAAVRCGFGRIGAKSSAGKAAGVWSFAWALFVGPPVRPTVIRVSCKWWGGGGCLRVVWCLDKEVRVKPQVLALTQGLEPRRGGELLMAGLPYITAAHCETHRRPRERGGGVSRFLAGRGRTETHDGIPGVVRGLRPRLQGRGLRQGLPVALRSVLVPRVAVLVLWQRGTLLGISCSKEKQSQNQNDQI